MIFAPQEKLLWNGSRVERLLRTGSTAPVLIEIAPVGYCNASCPWCFFRDKHSSSVINSALMFKALHDLAKAGIKAINWSGGGEPTLHPDFESFVEIAHGLGIQQGLFTNALQPIPKEGCFSWIRISLTDRGFEGIVKPEVPFGICLNQLEEHSEQDLIDYCFKAQAFGASYFQARPALVDPQPVMEAPTFLKKLEKPGFKVITTDYKYSESVKTKDYADCVGYHLCPSIDYEGNVSACLYRSNEACYVFGNLKEKSFSEIYENIPATVKVNAGCQNCCKLHEVNRAIARAKTVTHKYFL